MISGTLVYGPAVATMDSSPGGYIAPRMQYYTELQAYQLNVGTNLLSNVALEVEFIHPLSCLLTPSQPQEDTQEGTGSLVFHRPLSALADRL